MGYTTDPQQLLQAVNSHFEQVRIIVQGLEYDPVVDIVPQDGDGIVNFRDFAKFKIHRRPEPMKLTASGYSQQNSGGSILQSSHCEASAEKSLMSTVQSPFKSPARYSPQSRNQYRSFARLR